MQIQAKGTEVRIEPTTIAMGKVLHLMSGAVIASLVNKKSSGVVTHGDSVGG